MPTATATRTLISLDRAIETAKKVVAAKGSDYVYVKPADRSGFGTACSYSDPNGGASCLVGYMVRALRPKTFKEIVQYEAEHGSFGADSLTKHDHTTDPDDYDEFGEYKAFEIFEPEAERFLSELQDNQDSGRTWGFALEQALALVGRD